MFGLVLRSGCVMLVQRFRVWSETAPVDDRVRAVRRLAAAWRAGGLAEDERETSRAVMTVVLDDPSPKVRVALAEGLSRAANAPRHVVLALARDVPAVAAPILRSPGLRDADLLAMIEGGDEAAALAVAERVPLDAALALAVVAHGTALAVLRLLDNPSVLLAPLALDRLADRFRDDAAVRVRLLAEEGLDPLTARRLRARHAAALLKATAGRGWLDARRAERIAAETRDGDILAMAGGTAGQGTALLVRDAAAAGHLTPALLLRAAVNGQCTLLEHAFAHLAGLPVARVRASLRASRRTALAALGERTGIAPPFMELLARAWRVWIGSEADDAFVARRVVRELAASGRDLPPAAARLLAELEVAVEREAALRPPARPQLAAA